MVFLNITVGDEVDVRVTVGVSVLVGMINCGVVDPSYVALGLRFGITCWSLGTGVQVSGSLGWVGVLLGINRAAGMVGGGSGLNGEYGLRKITANTAITVRMPRKAIRERVFHNAFFIKKIIP